MTLRGNFLSVFLQVLYSLRLLQESPGLLPLLLPLVEVVVEVEVGFHHG